jgi:hypothetical protein
MVVIVAQISGDLEANDVSEHIKGERVNEVAHHLMVLSGPIGIRWILDGFLCLLCILNL